MSADDIRELFRLIDWLIALPEDLEEEFHTEFHEYEKETEVPYVTSWERAGIRKGLLEGIGMLLDVKFKSPGRELLPNVAAIRDADQLRAFMRFLKKAKTVDQVREHLGRTSK